MMVGAADKHSGRPTRSKPSRTGAIALCGAATHVPGSALALAGALPNWHQPGAEVTDHSGQSRRVTARSMPAPCAVLRLGPSVEAGLPGKLPGLIEWRKCAGRSGRDAPNHRGRASAARSGQSALALPQPLAVPASGRQHDGQLRCAFRQLSRSSTVENRLSVYDRLLVGAGVGEASHG